LRVSRRLAIAAAGVLLSCAAAHAQTQNWHVWPGDPVKPQPAPPATAAPAPPAPTPAPAAAGPETDHTRLGRAIVRKFENPEFAAARSKRGVLPPPSHGMAEELPIRALRDRIALARHAPPGAKVLTIPKAPAPPNLDGIVDAPEWRGALVVPLEPAERRAVAFLMTHGGRIYLAGQAPRDTTPTGFDQFRFWYHLDLSPYFVNEKTTLDGRGGARMLVLRWTRVPIAAGVFLDSPPRNSLRDDVDWGVYAGVQGASVVQGFRQYEMSIDLAEAGLPAGVPFPAFIEIEGDPVYEGDRFRARVMEGQAGSQQNPLWLRITPSKNNPGQRRFS
jgi:hypothetical protein